VVLKIGQVDYKALVDKKSNWGGFGSKAKNVPRTQYIRPEKPPKQETKPEPAMIKSKTAETKTQVTSPSRSEAKKARRSKSDFDLASKLKFDQLSKKFFFVEDEILESVFLQTGHNLQTSLQHLYDMYRHVLESPVVEKVAQVVHVETAHKIEPSKSEAPKVTPKTKKAVKEQPEPEGEAVTETGGQFTKVAHKKRKANAGNGNFFHRLLLDDISHLILCRLYSSCCTTKNLCRIS
jgi:hypothetical protein